MKLRRQWIRLVCLSVSVCLLGGAGTAYSASKPYPTKAIEYVLGAAAGGGTDVPGRVFSKYFSQVLGVPFNVVNKPGGNAIPAVLSVLSATPDGYVLLLEQESSGALQALQPNVPYKFEDRTFGPMWGKQYGIAIFVNGKSPWKTLKEAAEAMKKEPASYSVSWLGGTTMSDLTLLQFLSAAGIDVSKVKRVKFDGSGPAQIAVAGGHVHLGTGGPGATLPLVASGDLKVLAISGDRRITTLPNVPSATEAGFPSVDVRMEVGISGPVRLPKNIVERLDQAAKKVAENKDFQKELDATGMEVVYIPSSQARDHNLKRRDIFKQVLEKTLQ